MRPTRVNLEMADRCCLRCAMCDIWRHKGAGELDIEEWLRTFDDLVDWLGSFRLTVTGGEPFMKRGIWAFLSHVTRKGIPTAVITNGYTLGDRSLERLLSFPVTSVTFSIDSLDGSVHDAIRGIDGAFNRTLNAIKTLGRSRRRFILATSTVVVDANVDSLSEMCLRLTSFGVDRIFLQPVQGGFTDASGRLWPFDSPLWPKSRERVVASFERLLAIRRSGVPLAHTVDELLHMRDYLVEGAQWRRPWRCEVGSNTLHIDAYGNVRMCVPFPGNIGNVRQLTCRQIWESQTATQERSVIAHCTKPCLLNCNRTLNGSAAAKLGLQMTGRLIRGFGPTPARDA